MAYSKKRLAEIKAERKARKKQKQKEKRHLRALEKAKAYRRKYYKKYREQKKKEEIAELKAAGDEKGVFTVMITKNNKKFLILNTFRTKIAAYKEYNEAVEKNHNSVVFPKTVMMDRRNSSHGLRELKYEILLLKKVKEGENTSSYFRDKDGKFVENIVTDLPDRVILEKDDWYIEETFGIYGYHPIKEKKDYTFILDNLILNNEDEMRRIMVWKNKVVIQYLDDFDFVTCCDNNQAKTFYDRLESDITKLKKKYIVFMGEISSSSSAKWLDKFEEKTGINRFSLTHSKTVG